MPSKFRNIISADIARTLSIFIFILISLQSFSTYRLVLPLALVLVCFSFRHMRLGVQELGWGAFVVCGVLVHALLLGYNDSAIVDLAYLRSAVAGVLITTILALYWRQKPDSLQTGIDFALALNVLFLLIQALLLYLKGIKIDPTGSLLGIPARMDGPPLWGITLWRPSGFTFEPGTYATYVMPLLYFSYYLRGGASWLHWLSVLSLLATFSVFAIVFALIFLVVIFAKQLSKHRKLAIIFAVLMIVTILPAINEYVQWRFFSGRQDVSLLTKLVPLEFWIEQPFLRQLLGSGFGVNDCGCLVRDTSLLFNILFTFGVFGMTFVLLFVWKLRSSFLLLVFAAGFFISKMPMFSPLFWVCLAIFLLLPSLDIRRAHSSNNSELYA